MSYTLTIRFRLWDLFVWRKDCAGHDCKSMMRVIWLDSFDLGMGRREVGSHDMNMRGTIPDHLGHNIRSRGVVLRTSTYLAITPYICAGMDARREENASRLRRLDIKVMFNAYMLVVIDAPVVLRIVECLMSLIETSGFGVRPAPNLSLSESFPSPSLAVSRLDATASAEPSHRAPSTVATRRPR